MPQVPDNPEFKFWEEIEIDCRQKLRRFRVVTKLPLNAAFVSLCPGLPLPGSLHGFKRGLVFEDRLALTEYITCIDPKDVQNSGNVWIVTAKYGTSPPPLDATTQANKEYKTFSPMQVPVDIRIGETTVKGVGSYVQMKIGERVILSRKITIVLEMEAVPSITVEYIEK